VAELIFGMIEKKENIPVLVFDLTGLISAAICARVMLLINKAWPKEIAMAYIMNKRYEVKDMPAWLFQ
jgi:hypothetical protein